MLSLIFSDGLSRKIGDELKNHNILVSYESEYLHSRSLLQIAVMGYHSIEEVKRMTHKLKAILFSSEEYYLQQLALVVYCSVLLWAFYGAFIHYLYTSV